MVYNESGEIISKKGNNMTKTFKGTDYVVFDFETCGLDNYHKYKIIEIAAVKVRNNKIVDEFETFVNPQIPIPDKISAITGITDNMVKDAPIIDDIINDFYRFIGNDVLIGHKINGYDVNILSQHFTKLLGITLKNNFVDTCELSRAILPIQNHSLADVCNYYNVINKHAHRALSDVKATYECYQHLRKGGINESFVEEPKPKHKPKPQYTDETKALQTLQGMLFGVTCDGILTEAEVMAIKKWLEQHKHLSGNYPFDVAYSEIEKALEDDVLEAHELNSLLNTFIMLTDPVQTCSCECSSLALNGIKVCLSGEFSHGTKTQVSELLVSLGAELSDSVNKKVGILIVGDKGSDLWLCGNYGKKVKQAKEMQDKGSDIKIISETDFYKRLEVTQNV